MSGGYGHQPLGQQRSRVAVLWMVAAALLVVAAALAFGGNFAAFFVHRLGDTPDADIITRTGWAVTHVSGSDGRSEVTPSPWGIALTVAAVLAVAAAVLLLLTASRPGNPTAGRLVGVGASGLLIGMVSVIWLYLLTTLNGVNSIAEDARLGSLRPSATIGFGAYLELAAALAALTAAVLLLVPRRSGVAMPVAAQPGPGPFPPFGPGDQQHRSPGSPPWHEPGPAVPQPGWGPPPAPPHHR